MKKTIVISAINFRSGGPLTILRDCLSELSRSELSKRYKIIALVHKRELADYPNIEYLEFPKSINSWLYRIYYEYFYFRKLSKQLRPYLWLSLHDMTPNVACERQAVYMHNPSIVNKIKPTDWKFDKAYILFACFYKFLYRLNVKRNLYCIVQQQWFRKVCAKQLNLSEKKFIVARPLIEISSPETPVLPERCKEFFFPSLPRPFKNFETLCEAACILENKGIKDFEVRITLSGEENSYSKWIYKQYSHCKSIKFLGLLDKNQMKQNYEEADCLVFPSRLETWGLPVSEFIPFGKPMIIADEPYAHETAQGALCVDYFDTNNAKILSDKMEKLIKGDYSALNPVPQEILEQPYASSYTSLFDLLLN